jgi:hypothetical protein
MATSRAYGSVYFKCWKMGLKEEIEREDKKRVQRIIQLTLLFVALVAIEKKKS